MKERPILMSAEMVRAVMDESKTQTRRIIRFRVAPDDPMCHSVWLCWQGGSGQVPRGRREHEWQDGDALIRCPFGYVGDRLFVRETAYIAPPHFGHESDCNWKDSEGRPRVVSWAASMDSDSVRCATDYGVKATPSIFMPRWASRLTLEITAVRAERLQEISDADAQAEGVRKLYRMPRWAGGEAVKSFQELWDAINGKRASWNSNPWVWCLEFRVVKP